MPKHPLELLSYGAIRAVSLWLLAAWALMTLFLVAILPFEILERATALAATRDSAAARALVASWPPALRVSAAFLLGFDFLYDLVHNNAVACMCLWAAFHGKSAQKRIARTFAWTLWLCTLLNVPENWVYVRLLHGLSVDPWVGVAGQIASLRFFILWSGFVVGAALLFLSHVRSRQHADS